MDKKTIMIAVGGALLALAILLFSQSLGSGVTVGICYAEPTNTYTAPYRQSLEQALTQQGYTLDIVIADADQSRQLEQIAQLQSEGCDALIVEPVMLSAAQELLTAIDSTQLPAVLINRLPEESLLSGYSKIAAVGNDSTLPGGVLGQLICRLPSGGDINGDGTVSYAVILGPEGSQDSALLTQSFDSAFSDSELTAQLLSIGYSDWTQENSKELSQQLLSAYGRDIEVILCADSTIAQGALEAVDGIGLTPGQDIFLCGIGADEAMVQLIRQDKLVGAVKTDADNRVSTLLSLLEGLFDGENPAYTVLPVYSPVT